MPQLPLVRSERSSITTIPDATGTPEDFGAGIGRAMQGLGRAVGGLADTVNVAAARQRDQDTANIIANANFFPVYNSIIENAPEGGANVAENVRKAHQDWAFEQYRTIKDPVVRQKVKAYVESDAREWVNKSIQAEGSLREASNIASANSSLNALTNSVLDDPSSYDKAVEKSNAVIDARPGIDATTKQKMKLLNSQNLAEQRFNGMLQNVKSNDDLLSIEKQLSDTKWKEAFKPEAYEQINRRLIETRNKLHTVIRSEASAAIDALKNRDDPRTLIPGSELVAAEAKAKAAVEIGDTKSYSDYLVIAKQQETYRQMRGLNPAGVRGTIGALRDADAGKKPTSYIPAGVAAGSTQSVIAQTVGNAGGNVAAALAFGERESGFRVNVGGTGSISGLFQMTGDLQRRYGISGGASNAEQQSVAFNKHARFLEGAMTRTLGRTPTSAELYLGWHFGEVGGPSLIRAAERNPDMTTREWAMATFGPTLGEKVLSGNPHVAAAKTVGNLYNSTVGDIAKRMAKYGGDANAPYSGGAAVPNGLSRNQYTSLQAAEKFQRDQDKALKEDMMSWSSQVGLGTRQITLNDLTDEASFSTRGDMARDVAAFNNIANAEATPLTKTEVEQLVQTVKNGTTDEKAQAFANIAALGGDMATAGFRQIGENDGSLRYVGSLYQSQPDMAVSVLRGRQVLDTDKTAAGVFDGNKDRELFRSELASTIRDLRPEVRNGIFEAARARYIDKYGTAGTFDQTKFKEAMQEVAGPVANVAGGKMILPEGVDERTMNDAVARATVDDYVAMSATGSPPFHGNGQVVQPREIEMQGQFSSIGNDQYFIRFPDDTFAVVPGPDGRLRKYVFVADTERLQDMAKRNAEGLPYGQRGTVREVVPGWTGGGYYGAN